MEADAARRVDVLLAIIDEQRAIRANLEIVQNGQKIGGVRLRGPKPAGVELCVKHLFVAERVGHVLRPIGFLIRRQVTAGAALSQGPDDANDSGSTSSMVQARSTSS